MRNFFEGGGSKHDTQKKKRNPKKFKIMVHRQRMQIDERSSSNVVNNVLIIFYPFSQKNINKET